MILVSSAYIHGKALLRQFGKLLNVDQEKKGTNKASLWDTTGNSTRTRQLTINYALLLTTA